MTVAKWYTVLVIAAFASVISFFNINSAFADAHKVNGLFKIAGIIFGLVAAYSYYMANKLGNPGDPKNR